MSDSRVHYTERLTVPWMYWVIGLFFGLTFVTAVSFMLGEFIFVFSTLAVAGLIAWVLVVWGSLTLTVDDEGVQVGRSRLEWGYLGTVQQVDAEQRQRLLARDDIHLALRPYVAPTVVLGVVDEADPHLCWLVSTRDPEGFVRAIADNRPAGAGRQPEETTLDSGG